MINKLLNKTNLWKKGYLLSLFLLIISFLFILLRLNDYNRVILCVSYLTSLGAFVLYLKYSKTRAYDRQLIIIYTIWSLIWDLTLLNNLQFVDDFIYLFSGVIASNIPFLILVYRVSKYKNKRIKDTLKENWLSVVITIIFIALCLETLRILPKLDSNVYFHYFQDLKTWDLSLFSLNKFFLGGHPSFSYAAIGLIGVYLTPYSAAGIRVISIILAIFSFLCVSDILHKTFFNISKNTIILIASIYLFNPLTLGIIYEINLDFPQLCFFIFLIWAYINKFHILFFLFSISIVFCKETGIIILFGFGFMWLILELIKIYKTKIIEFALIWKTLFSLFMPAILFLTVSMQGLLWRQDSINNDTKGEQVMNSLGFRYDNFIMKTKEIFIFNFNWILSIIVIVGFIYFLFRICKKSKMKASFNVEFFLIIMASSFSFLVFQYIYITYLNIRYINLLLIPILLLTTWAINLIYDKRIITVSLIIINCLILLQCFFTMDPITNALSRKIDIGNANLLTTRTYVKSSENNILTWDTDQKFIKNLELTTSAIYNRQFSYFQFAFEEVLKRIDYNNDVYIKVVPIYDFMTWNSLFGDYYSDSIHYNPVNMHLSSNNNHPFLNLEVLPSEDPNLIYNEKFNDTYVISFPYNSLFNEHKYLNKMELEYIDSVEKKGWIIDVYKLVHE